MAEVEPGAFAPANALWLKLEFMQHSGSFKVRGAFNRMLAAAEAGGLPPEGIIAASGGNAGLAVAFAAQALEVPADVYLPTTAPRVKVDKLRQLGAVVVQHGGEYAEAYDAAVKRTADTGALFCHAYDQPEICAGQGTLALELFDQLGGALDTVVLAVGGGGLMAGVAAALEGQVQVIAVEPDTILTLHAALAVGGPVDVEVSGIAADSLGARRIGTIAYDVAGRTGVRSVLVPDEAIIAARRLLWDHRRVVIEHGTAAALAALTCGAYQPGAGERVAILLCGANTDPGDLAGATNRVTSAVVAVPPMSGVRVRSSARLATMVVSKAVAGSSRPRWRSMSTTEASMPTGLAKPCPAMSRAEPCTGSNIDGCWRVGSRLALAAMPIDPATAAVRSDRMSPKRLDARITSSKRGSSTTRAASASMRSERHCTVAKPSARRATTSSQNGIVCMSPLDLVADTRCPCRDAASSNA